MVNQVAQTDQSRSRKSTRISVIVPAFNEEGYIANCLRSLLNQSFSKQYEVIVVDNGSTDRTKAIAKKYADRVVIEERKGVAFARNTGVDHASGDLLVFLDADSIVPRNFLTLIDETFSDPKVVGATCRAKPLNPNPKGFLTFKAYNLFIKLSMLINMDKTWGSFLAVRRNVFEKTDGFSQKRFEDLDLVAKVRKHGKFDFIKEIHILTSSRMINSQGIIGAIKCYVFGFLFQWIKERIGE